MSFCSIRSQKQVPRVWQVKNRFTQPPLQGLRSATRLRCFVVVVVVALFGTKRIGNALSLSRGSFECLSPPLLFCRCHSHPAAMFGLMSHCQAERSCYQIQSQCIQILSWASWPAVFPSFKLWHTVRKNNNTDLFTAQTLSLYTST